MGVNGHWYIELEKQGFWRGQPHIWANRYVMSGAQPSASDANAVIDQIKNMEDAIHPAKAAGAGVGFTFGKAYPSGKGTFFAEQGFNPTLAASTATGFGGPTWGSASLTWAPTLETCMLVETLVNGLNSRGKPIYLRKFYRGITSGPVEDAGSGQMASADVAGVTAAVARMQSGFGTNNWVVIANSGAQAAQAPTCHPFLVAHQVPRGKRKPKTAANILTLAEDALKLRGALGLAADVAELGAA